jgi:hypothetical protein
MEIIQPDLVQIPTIELSTKNPPTIHDLRKAGYKVRIVHARCSVQGIKDIENLVKNGTKKRNLPTPRYYLRKEFKNSENIAAKGGVTVVEVTTPQGKTYRGDSVCYFGDAFNRKLSVKIAMGRLVSSILKDVKHNA